MKPKIVAIPIFPNVQPLDATGPGTVFGTASRLAGKDLYRVRFIANATGPVQTSSGFSLHADDLKTLKPEDVDTLVVAGGDEFGIRGALADKRFMNWITRTATQARRACSVCSGAFLLARTGLLDGKRVATHWEATGELAQSFPQIEVDGEAIYVNEGKCWTSAGVTTGIDMSLALVEADFGRDLAMAVARQLVVYMRRPGHQTQFSAALTAQATKDDRFADLSAWVEANLHKRLDVETLAARVNMSPRSFHRHCQAELGVSPAKFVEAIRLDAVRRLLDARTLDIGQVAGQTGFSGSDHLIRAFERRFGVTPGVYREMHAAA